MTNGKEWQVTKETSDKKRKSVKMWHMMESEKWQEEKIDNWQEVDNLRKVTNDKKWQVIKVKNDKKWRVTKNDKRQKVTRDKTLQVTKSNEMTKSDKSWKVTIEAWQKWTSDKKWQVTKRDEWKHIRVTKSYKWQKWW